MADRRAVEHELHRPHLQQPLAVPGGRTVEGLPGLVEVARRGRGEHHRGHPQRAPAQGLAVHPHEVAGHRGVDHAGDPHGQQRAVVRREPRAHAVDVAREEAPAGHGLDRAHAALDEQPVEAPAAVARDHPPGRIGRAVVEARERQREAVRDRAVAGVVHREHRVARRGLVELLRGGRAALAELRLVPVEGDQPRAGREGRGGVGDGALQARDVTHRGGREAHEGAVERDDARVVVGVDEAREHRGAMEVTHRRVRARGAHDLRAVTHREERVAAPREGLGAAAVGDHGAHVGVEQHGGRGRGHRARRYARGVGGPP